MICRRDFVTVHPCQGSCTNVTVGGRWAQFATQIVVCLVIYPDFFLELTEFYPGTHLIHFLVLKMKDFWNFVLHNCILDFDAEQVYFKLQITNLKNKKVTANQLVFRKPYTLTPNS